MVGISKKFAAALHSLDRQWDRVKPSELADRITHLMNQASSQSEERAAQKRCFEFAFGSVREFRHHAKRQILGVARETLRKNSLKPLAKLGPSLAERITGRGA